MDAVTLATSAPMPLLEEETLLPAPHLRHPEEANLISAGYQDPS